MKEPDVQASSSVPWHRYGSIAYLAERAGGRDPQFGKTALQKLAYLVQDVYGVPLGYRFSLFHHGPYAPELAGDLDYVVALGGVRIQFREDGQRGFAIESGPSAPDLLARADAFIETYRDRLGGAIERFAGMTTRELELRATILFVWRQLANPNRDVVLEQVQRLKPQFAAETVSAAFDELERSQLLRP
jgi:uncharacterized protein